MEEEEEENNDNGTVVVDVDDEEAVDFEEPAVADGPALCGCVVVVIRDFIELRLERCDPVDPPPVFGVTVLSCSWMSIMWSPKRMLRLSGVFPLKKSLTWLSFRDSSACITVFSGRWA